MEVLSIANSFEGAAETVTLLAKDVSEAAIKAMNLAAFNILHFAVHGIHDTNYPAGSALVLGSQVNESEDGMLQAWEIARMQLKADLVVLSACNTAMGRSFRHDEISDLVPAFLLAGARTVVGSIWPLEDRSTAHLMTRFYAYLARGMDKGSALRQAKLDFIAKYKDAALPVLWAGMVMIGDSSDSIIDEHNWSFLDAPSVLTHFSSFNPWIDYEWLF
jgi:CHAT domain-containing protein